MTTIADYDLMNLNKEIKQLDEQLNSVRLRKSKYYNQYFANLTDKFQQLNTELWELGFTGNLSTHYDPVRKIFNVSVISPKGRQIPYYVNKDYNFIYDDLVYVFKNMKYHVEFWNAIADAKDLFPQLQFTIGESGVSGCDIKHNVDFYISYDVSAEETTNKIKLFGVLADDDYFEVTDLVSTIKKYVIEGDWN